MITLHPYISEVDAYHLVPLHHRWIFNKLELCERLGNGPCGPIGTWMPSGEYCIRPIINVGGMARGGFRKHIVAAHRDIMHEPHGYCWTPWTDALRTQIAYIDDEWVYTRGTEKLEDGIEYCVDGGPPRELPEQLKGISRYMLVESLGDIVIDVGPRHIVEEMQQEVIDEYRNRFDSEYQPPDGGHFGFQPRMRNVFDGRWSHLEEIEEWI